MKPLRVRTYDLRYYRFMTLSRAYGQRQRTSLELCAALGEVSLDPMSDYRGHIILI